MQGKMGIETRNIIRDSKPYHIIKTLKSIQSQLAIKIKTNRYKNSKNWANICAI
jgi:hypothetical protein